MILPLTDLKKSLLSFLNKHNISEKKEGILVNFAYKTDEINIISLIDPLLKVSKKIFYLKRPEKILHF